MSHAPSLARIARLAPGSCMLVLLTLLSATAHAEASKGYGELARFGTGVFEGGQLTPEHTNAIGVDPTGNTVYVLDEAAPEEENAKGERVRSFKLHRFTANPEGKYAQSASAAFTDTSPGEADFEARAVEGVAFDPKLKRVYVLAVDLRKLTLQHDIRARVASTLYAFSTEPSGETLVGGGKAGANKEILAGPAELQAQSDTPGKALLAPAGITVDAKTGDVIVLAHEDHRGEAEDSVRSNEDHFVLARVHSSGALGERYVDAGNFLKAREPESEEFRPDSPIVLGPESSPRVLVNFDGGLIEIPYKFEPGGPPKTLVRLFQDEHAPEERIVLGGENGLNGGALSVSPEGTIFDAANITSGPASESAAAVLLRSGADGAEIGWSGGQLPALASEDRCVLHPGVLRQEMSLAAGSEGKVFVLAPEFLVHENYPPPFYPAVIELGPGGNGCPQARVGAPSVEVNGQKLKEGQTVTPGSAVTFSSHVTQADALKVEWDFGDGTKETIAADQFQTTTSKPHVFAKEREYTVTETIYSDDLAAPTQQIFNVGRFSTPTIVASGKVSVKIEKPVAQFFRPTEVILEHAATFDGKLSKGSRGTSKEIVDYLWAFGDGTEVSTKKPTSAVSHVYGHAGVYTVSLRVIDELGLSSLPVSATVLVNALSGASATTTASAPPASRPAQALEVKGSKGAHVAPTATLAGASLTVSPSGVVKIRLSCAVGASSCSGSLNLRTLTAVRVSTHRGKPSILTLAGASFSLAGGQVEVVTLHLGATARALLARSRRLRARATIVASDASGASTTTRTIITLRLARRHRRR